MNFGLLIDMLFPQRCVACGENAEAVLCAPCRSRVPRERTLFCATCRARLPAARKICHMDAPMLLGAAGSYDTPAMKELVRALKFNGIRAAADVLGDILAEYAAAAEIPLEGYGIIPLPLSPARFRARGFNQSALIARRFAARMSLPVEENVLLRPMHRKPQSETKNLAERRGNILGCFAARAARAAGKSFVIIDDVVTSGATLTEAARTLKVAGAKKIIALAAARA